MAQKILLTSLAILSVSFVSRSPLAASPSAPPAQVVSASTPTATTPIAVIPGPISPNAATIVVTAQSTADTPEVKGQTDMNRVVCRTRPVLGSRLSKQRECRTVAEWEQIRRQAASSANGATRAMTGGMVRPGS